MTFLMYPSPKGLWPLRLCDLATFVWTDQPESLPFRFEGVKQLNVMSVHFQKKKIVVNFRSIRSELKFQQNCDIASK